MTENQTRCHGFVLRGGLRSGTLSLVADGPLDALLLETFGPRLLAYLVNVDEARIEARFRGGAPLHPEAEEVLRHLVPLAESVAKERLDHPGIPYSLTLDQLCEVPAGLDMSVANALRVTAGGELESPGAIAGAEGDDVKALLFRLARDAYPRLLTPVEEAWHQTHLSLYRHPLRADLQRAVHEDEQLSKMFPSNDGDLGRRGDILNSLGRGGTVQSVMFGEDLILAGWDLALISKSFPSLADLYEAVGVSVDVLRGGIAGEGTETRALLAFTGITTGDRSVETPWGALRPITDAERRSAPSMLEGGVSGTDGDGKSIIVSYAGEVVLDTTLPFALKAQAWEPGDDPPNWSTHTFGGFQARRRRSEALQLAVFLGIDRPAGQWATARFSWQWVADPSTQGRSISWSDPRSSPGFTPTELSKGECEALQRWCTLIESNWMPRIDIAVRRVLSAAQVRNDPADRLVDSVIAWENLFGTSEGEPRLRISAAMAWLIADSAAHREALQKEIKQLYDDRSKIVHGGTFDEAAIAEKANRALDLARSSLRVLFEDRPDVLLLPDGSARSLRLMLGG
jgi:hypothetical protein